MQGSEFVDNCFTGKISTVVLSLNISLYPVNNPASVFNSRPEMKPYEFHQPDTTTASRIEKSFADRFQRHMPRCRIIKFVDFSLSETISTLAKVRQSVQNEAVLFYYNSLDFRPRGGLNEIYFASASHSNNIDHVVSRVERMHINELFEHIGYPSIVVIEAYGNFDASAISSQHKNNILICGTKLDPEMSLHYNMTSDFLTTCLIDPMRMLLTCQFHQNRWSFEPEISLEILEALLANRNIYEPRTPEGELFLIYASIADAIAWSSLPLPAFRRYFRVDTTLARLLGNFLLAQHLSSQFLGLVQSSPPFPFTGWHRYWTTLLSFANSVIQQLPLLNCSSQLCQSATFFRDEMISFEQFVNQTTFYDGLPEHLPIVLQMLGDAAKRPKMLDILAKYFSMGSEPVKHAIFAGISIYMGRILRAVTVDLRGVTYYIWAKLVAVSIDLRRKFAQEANLQHFLRVIRSRDFPDSYPYTPCLIVALFVPQIGDLRVLIDSHVLETCFHTLGFSHPTVRKWLLLAISNLLGVSTEFVKQLEGLDFLPVFRELLRDDVPEVRATTLFCLRSYINKSPDFDEEAVILSLPPVIDDCSLQVRIELLACVHMLVKKFQQKVIEFAVRFKAHFVRTEPTDHPLFNFLSLILECQVPSLPANSQTASDNDSVSSHRDNSKHCCGCILRNTNFANVAPCDLLWRVVLESSLDPVSEIAHLGLFLIKTTFFQNTQTDDELQVDVNQMLSSFDYLNDVIVFLQPPKFLTFEDGALVSSLFSYSCGQFVASKFHETRSKDIARQKYHKFVDTCTKFQSNFYFSEDTRSHVVVQFSGVESLPLVMDIHPLRPIILGSTNKKLTYINWEERVKCSINYDSPHTKASLIHISLINDFSQSLNYIVGYDDGHMALMSIPDRDVLYHPNIRGCWRPFSHLMPLGGRSTMTVLWNTTQQRAYLSGANPRIVEWDMNSLKEYSVITLDDGSYVSSAALLPESPHEMVAGVDDREAGLVDFRENRFNRLFSFSGEPTNGLKIFTSNSVPHQFCCHTSGRTVKFYDLRGGGFVSSVILGAVTFDQVTMHPNMPLLSTRPNSHSFQLYSTMGDLVSTCKVRYNFIFTTKTPKIVSSCFHPLLPILAVANTVPNVCVFIPRKAKTPSVIELLNL